MVYPLSTILSRCLVSARPARKEIGVIIVACIRGNGIVRGRPNVYERIVVVRVS